MKIPAEEKNYFLRCHLCLFLSPRPIHEEPRQGLGRVGEQLELLEGCRVDFAATAQHRLRSPGTAKKAALCVELAN